MTALGEAVISGSAFGGGPTTPASPRSPGIQLSAKHAKICEGRDVLACGEAALVHHRDAESTERRWSVPVAPSLNCRHQIAAAARRV